MFKRTQKSEDSQLPSASYLRFFLLGIKPNNWIP